ncbi:MAG: Arylmalonate decarboxylase [Alphaproteobacteria bacterium MarineAlpha4_Bin2]|nr:MAG: Arylmalonate decarboxylase [Alphaproteobacteria bacterium MarineAlpha4_Bin2]
MSEERWIGERARIGVAIPSTNIAVEYDCQRIIPEGVTWHFGRFYIEVRDLSDDAVFLRFVEAIQETIPLSMRDLVTAEMTYAMMGMSAETFWGGRAGNEAFQERIREIIGPNIGLTTGANAADAALKAFSIKNIAVLTPYQPVADEQVRTFFGESGYEIKRLHGLKCDSAHGIANTPRDRVLDVVVNELNGDDIDAIVQVGTNLSTLDLFPTLERQLDKPMIAINVALIWHALRAAGIEDRFYGKGRLLEEF